jgi:hypothetical protein
MNGEAVGIYLMSVAISEQYRLWGEGVFQSAYAQLLTGFLDKLAWYAKRYRVRVTHLVAAAWTEQGKRICQHFGMVDLKEKDRYGHPLFELDLNNIKTPTRMVPALKRLLKIYSNIAS